VFLLLTACSVNRFSSNNIAKIRFKPLQNTETVKLAYAPKAKISITGDAEYFNNLDYNEGYKYEQLFVNKLADYNMVANFDRNRFEIEITEIEFTEEAEYKCKTDTTNGKEYCFWLNDLDITIKMEVVDHSTHKSKSFTSNVTESTEISSKMIGKGYMETGDYLNHEDFITAMMNSCFIKCAGKAAGHIRKQNKKHG